VDHRQELHHSNQGVQCATNGYVERLRATDIQVSMPALGQTTNNPHAERLICTVEEEGVYLN
jgi:hypothetical protein